MIGQGPFIAHLLEEVQYLRGRVEMLEQRLWQSPPGASQSPPAAPVLEVTPAVPFPPEVQDAIDSRAEEDQDTRRVLEAFARSALAKDPPTAVAMAILQGQNVDEV